MKGSDYDIRTDNKASTSLSVFFTRDQVDISTNNQANTIERVHRSVFYDLPVVSWEALVFITLLIKRGTFCTDFMRLFDCENLTGKQFFSELNECRIEPR